MSGIHPAVDWILDLLGPVVDSVATDYTLQNGDPVVLKRVDRDTSEIYDGSGTVDMTAPLHKRTKELKTGTFVGATYVSKGGDLVGTEPMLDGDVVINVRIEGMHYNPEYGHVDPAGENGIPFDELVNRIRDAIWAELRYPDVGDPRVSYRHLHVADDPQSVGWTHFFRHSLDVTLFGYEDLSNQ